MARKKHEEGRGMRSATLPKEHWEHDENTLDVSNMKYASDFGNPKDLEKSVKEEADYLKKNRAKY